MTYLRILNILSLIYILISIHTEENSNNTFENHDHEYVFRIFLAIV